MKWHPQGTQNLTEGHCIYCLLYWHLGAWNSEQHALIRGYFCFLNPPLIFLARLLTELQIRIFMLITAVKSRVHVAFPASVHKTRTTCKSLQALDREAIVGPWGIWTMFGDFYFSVTGKECYVVGKAQQ